MTFAAPHDASHPEHPRAFKLSSAGDPQGGTRISTDIFHPSVAAYLTFIPQPTAQYQSMKLTHLPLSPTAPATAGRIVLQTRARSEVHLTMKRASSTLEPRSTLVCQIKVLGDSSGASDEDQIQEVLRGPCLKSPGGILTLAPRTRSNFDYPAI